MAISKLFALNANTMMQLWQKGKNPTFEPSLGTPKFFPWVLPLLVVRQCFKLSSYAISRKTNGPNLKKNDKKPNFKPNFGPNLGHYIFLQVLPLLGKMATKLEKMGGGNNFGSGFGPFCPKVDPLNFFSWVLPLLDVIRCCKLSLYAISRKTNEPNLRK